MSIHIPTYTATEAVPNFLRRLQNTKKKDTKFVWNMPIKRNILMFYLVRENGTEWRKHHGREYPTHIVN